MFFVHAIRSVIPPHLSSLISRASWLLKIQLRTRNLVA